MEIRPIRSPEELDMVHGCAKQDNHFLAWPTHVIRRGGDVVGSLSVIPMVLVWTRSDMKVRESIEVKNTYEALAANQSRVVCVPCFETSPYFQLLPKDNYIDLGSFNLFTKGI